MSMQTVYMQKNVTIFSNYFRMWDAAINNKLRSTSLHRNHVFKSRRSTRLHWVITWQTITRPLLYVEQSNGTRLNSHVNLMVCMSIFRFDYYAYTMYIFFKIWIEFVLFNGHFYRNDSDFFVFLFVFQIAKNHLILTIQTYRLLWQHI